MGFDPAELQRLEGVYLSSRDQDDMGTLYLALIDAGGIILNAYLAKKCIKLNSGRRSEIVHDASTRLLEMYLKYDDQESMPIYKRMCTEINFQLHNRKQIKYDQCGGITPFMESKQEKKPAPELALFISDIQADAGVDGKRIVIDLYMARYYKWAILEIAKYTSRVWIREKAVELRTIYLLTRRCK